MHIGLIGGIGPAATEFYYRHIVRAHAGADRTLELTVAHADLRDFVRNMATNAAAVQGKIFGALSRRLQAAGADVVAITSIAGHFCVREFEAMSPLRVIDVIPAVRAELDRLQVRRVALIGTRVVMESRLYGGLDGLEVLVPQGDDFSATHHDYLAMAGVGEVSEEQRDLFFRIGRRLHREGADVVVLGGTDLFLAFDGRDCGFPTVDCARVHIDVLNRISMA